MRRLDSVSSEDAKSPGIFLAVYHGDIDRVIRLIEEGVDVNERNTDGWSPLHCVCQKPSVFEPGKMKENTLKIAKALLDAGSSVKAVENLSERTPLHLAAWYGFTDVCQLLIQRGADINALDDDGNTPLHSAATRGSVDVIKLLLEVGVHLALRNNSGCTPMMLAVRNERDNSLSTLLSAHQIAKEFYSNRQLESAVNLRDFNGKSALHEAARIGNSLVVDLLLKAGANRSVKDKDGFYPKDFAANGFLLKSLQLVNEVDDEQTLAPQKDLCSGCLKIPVEMTCEVCQVSKCSTCLALSHATHPFTGHMVRPVASRHEPQQNRRNLSPIRHPASHLKPGSPTTFPMRKGRRASVCNGSAAREQVNSSFDSGRTVPPRKNRSISPQKRRSSSKTRLEPIPQRNGKYNYLELKPHKPLPAPSPLASIVEKTTTRGKGVRGPPADKPKIHQLGCDVALPPIGVMKTRRHSFAV